MTVINHDLRCVDGKTIYSIPEKGGSSVQGNLALPNVYEESATALYDIGTKFVDGERVFHYAYAGEDLTTTLRGVTGYVARTDNDQDTYDTAQAVGVGTVATPFKFDGQSADTPAVNAWAGQYIMIKTSATYRVTMRIVSHLAAEHDSPYTIAAVLDQPTPVAIDANVDCDIFPSRYADIRIAVGGTYTGEMYPILGVHLIPITSGRYFWLQTWGPAFVTCYDVELGDVAFERTAAWHSDGTITPCDHSWGIGTPTSKQFAGFTLATNGAGSEWIMMMCDR